MSYLPSGSFPTLDLENPDPPTLVVGQVYTEGLKNWICRSVNSETGDGTWDPMVGEFPFDPAVNDRYTIGAKTYYYNGSAWVHLTAAQAATLDFADSFKAYVNALPTTDPEVVGSPYLNSGVLTVSAGPAGP